MRCIPSEKCTVQAFHSPSVKLFLLEKYTIIFTCERDLHAARCGLVLLLKMIVRSVTVKPSWSCNGVGLIPPRLFFGHQLNREDKVCVVGGRTIG